PRNPIRRRFDVPTLHQVRDRISKAFAQTIQQRPNSELDIRDARGPTRLDFQHDSIHSSHPALGTIVDAFVETISDQIHQPPPKICKGIATIASTNARLMIAITTAFEN